MAEPTPGDLDLDELYAKSRASGDYDEKLLAWRYRLARAHARRAVAESQLRRLTAMETAGLEVKAADVHTVELELGDAAGSIAFCHEMVRAASAPPQKPTPPARPAPQPQQTNGGKKP